LDKIRSVMTVARPSVATARLTPRARMAGSATMMPIGIVATAPKITATGNGSPHTWLDRAAISAPTPASAY